MKRAFLAIAAVALLLVAADDASARPRWGVSVGYGGGYYGGSPYYGGYGWGGPGISAAYGTRVGSSGFLSVGYSSGFGYGYPAYGYPAYGYASPVYAAPVYTAPMYYSTPYYSSPYYYGSPSIGFSYSRWR